MFVTPFDRSLHGRLYQHWTIMYDYLCLKHLYLCYMYQDSVGS